MVLLANQSVTFRNPRTGLTVAAVVRISPVSRDARLSDDAARFQWEVSWDPTLTYSDGKAVGANHEIIWSQIQQPNNSATLHMARQTFGLLPKKCAYFVEAAH